MEYKISASAISQAVKLRELQEDELYEMLGEALIAHETLGKIPDEYVETKGLRASLTLTEAELREKGKGFFDGLREKLFNAICVKAKACKWEKDILDDVKTCVKTLVPLIIAAIGVAFPAAIPIAIAMIILKLTIRIFCKCP